MAKTFDIHPGATLPNGAIIIASTPATDKDSGVILAINHPGTPDAEYVTWRHGDGATFWGRYFRQSLNVAMADYADRVGRMDAS